MYVLLRTTKYINILQWVCQLFPRAHSLLSSGKLVISFFFLLSYKLRLDFEMFTLR